MDNNTGASGQGTPLFIEMQSGNELTELIPSPHASAVVEQENSTPEARTTTADPEFDAYMAAIKLLVGGAVEGAAELARRLEKWQAELQAAEAEGQPGAGESQGDIVRYMLVGMALSAGESARRGVIKLAQSSNRFWRFTGQAAKPLANSRLTGVVGRPLDRALEQLTTRSQQQVDDWIALGQAHEPGARRMARDVYKQIVDDFIGHLAENQELANLVQEQGVSLASEAVDEIRSRTVSADAMAEGLVRHLLRRRSRRELPPPPEELRQAVEDINKPIHRP
jgi:hypothetical protein